MLRDLFRHKLENKEIIPSSSVRTGLLHRLGRREFLRFNPSRFNIWYAGAIVTAGAALALILSVNNGNNYKIVPDTVEPAEIEKTDDPGLSIVSPVNQATVHGNQNIAMQKTESSEEITGPEAIKQVEEVLPDKRNDIPSRSEISGTHPEDGLFRETVVDKSRLMGVKLAADLIKSSVTKGCCPLKVAFEAKTTSFDYCRWTFGDGGYSTEKNPEWIFDIAGEYNVTLQIFDSKGLQSVSTSVITVDPKPVARFEILEADAIMPDDKVSFANFSTDGVYFRWYFGDGNTSDLFEPVHTYQESGNYNISLVVTSEQACSDTLTVSNAFDGTGNFIRFPNAFIPNLNGPSNGYYSSSSDDAAHVFHPVSSGVSEYQLRIFSKQGVLIFESYDINIGWDGYYKGQLCQSGVYIWKVRGNFINGESFTKMGDLTLLKI